MTEPDSSIRASVSSSLSKTTDHLFISENKIYLESITIKIYLPPSPTLRMFDTSIFLPSSFLCTILKPNAFPFSKVKENGQRNKSESPGHQREFVPQGGGGRRSRVLTHCGDPQPNQAHGWVGPGARLFLPAPQELWGWAWARAASENSHLLLRKALMGPRAVAFFHPPFPSSSSSSLFAYRCCTISKSVRQLLQTWTHPSVNFFRH